MHRVRRMCRSAFGLRAKSKMGPFTVVESSSAGRAGKRAAPADLVDGAVLRASYVFAGCGDGRKFKRGLAATPFPAAWPTFNIRRASCAASTTTAGSSPGRQSRATLCLRCSTASSKGCKPVRPESCRAAIYMRATLRIGSRVLRCLGKTDFESLLIGSMLLLLLDTHWARGALGHTMGEGRARRRAGERRRAGGRGGGGAGVAQRAQQYLPPRKKSSSSGAPAMLLASA